MREFCFVLLVLVYASLLLICNPGSTLDLNTHVACDPLETQQKTHSSPILVIGILSQSPQRDELIYDVVRHFKGVREGSVKTLFVRCTGIDKNTIAPPTKQWTVLVNCSSGARKWELCDKTLGWLNFATNHYPGAEFIAKVDDDSFVNVDRLLTFMRNLSWTWPSRNLYVGRGMQVYTRLHNGMCFGPVPFIGGMIQVFSSKLVSELHCSNSIVGGMGEDFVLGHSLMHTKVHYVMISCEECFHDKEIPFSHNSIVVHGFKASSEPNLLYTAHQLNKLETGVEDYRLVTYESHSDYKVPFHLWAGSCSNGCISVVALRPEKVGKFQQLVRDSKEKIVAFDMGLPFEDFQRLSFELRSKIDLQRFPVKNPSQQTMMKRVFEFYNTTCAHWNDL